MLYFYHLLFTRCHVFLILHKTANVPGPFPENLVIYDQNEVESSALKPSWLLHHWTSSRNVKCLSQPAADQIKLRQHWGLIPYLYPLICCLSITSIPLLPHSGADVYIMICYTSVMCSCFDADLILQFRETQIDKELNDGIKLYCRA